MSRWLGDYNQALDLRDTSFNRSVALCPESVESMISNFDGLFSNLTSYKDEISGLWLYPFSFKSLQGIGYLTTTHGQQLDTRAMNLSSDNGSFVLGYFMLDALDYISIKYTKYSLWLPYFGFVDLDLSKCAQKYVIIRLVVDYYNGKGMYYLSVTDEKPAFRNCYDKNTYDETVFYTVEFQLAVQIPLGESNISDISRNLTLGAIKAGASVAIGAVMGAKGGVVTGSSSSVTTVEDTSVASARGDYKGARMIPRSSTVTTGSETTNREYRRYANPYQITEDTIGTSVGILNSNFGSGNGDRTNNPMLLWSLPRYPILVSYKPIVDKVTKEYRHLRGVPLGLILPLNELSGYTKIGNIHIDNVGSATESEKDIIASALHHGVILPQTNNRFILKISSQPVAIVTNSMTWEQLCSINTAFKSVDNFVYVLTKNVGWSRVVGDDGEVNTDDNIYPEYTYYINIPTYKMNVMHMNASYEGPDTIQKGQTVTLHFTADEGYTLPYAVYVNNVTNVTWRDSTGTLILSNPTGNVTVRVNAV